MLSDKDGLICSHLEVLDLRPTALNFPFYIKFHIFHPELHWSSFAQLIIQKLRGKAGLALCLQHPAEHWVFACC